MTCSGLRLKTRWAFLWIQRLRSENPVSIGLNCGQNGGRKMTTAPLLATASTNSLYMWMRALSMTTIELGKGHLLRWGRIFSTNVSWNVKRVNVSGVNPHPRNPEWLNAASAETRLPRAKGRLTTAGVPIGDHACLRRDALASLLVSSTNTNCSGYRYTGFKRYLKSEISCGRISRALLVKTFRLKPRLCRRARHIVGIEMFVRLGNSFLNSSWSSSKKKQGCASAYFLANFSTSSGQRFFVKLTGYSRRTEPVFSNKA